MKSNHIMLWYFRMCWINLSVYFDIYRCIFLREGVRKKTEKLCPFDKPPLDTPSPVCPFFREKKLASIFFENEPLVRETNFTLGPIQKPLYLLLLYQFTFAHYRPKSEISGALGPIHYITLKAFAMALGDGTKCKTSFEGPRMILHAHWKNTFPK